MDVLKQLSRTGLIPVIKLDSPDDAVPLCKALSDGGLPVAEITFRTAAAAESIRRVTDALPDVLTGAGTVLNAEQAKQAADAGASFVVSPGFDPGVVGWCVEHNLPVLPGCSNPTDFHRALAYGLRAVKLFPAEALGGVRYLKAVNAPFPELKFVPTGGVNPQNLRDYLNCPCVTAVGGSWLTPIDAIRARDWRRVEQLARDAVNLMLGLTVRHIGINDTSDEDARSDALALSRLMGWKAEDCGKAWFAGDGFEVLKRPGRGEKGHIAIATDSVERAMFQWQRRGFVFEDQPVTAEGGVIKAIYLKNTVGGFAIHLLQK